MLGKSKKEVKYPGVRQAMDGNTAVIMCERESSDAAGAYPITPSTQMGEFWAEEMSKGHINISGRPLIFVEPEGEHAAAAVTAGMAMTGLRATNFSSGQGIAYMHESLYPAVGKRLTYILNMGCRAITKTSLNVHAGHDDYHSVDDTGFFQVMGKSAQEVCDLNIIAHKIAELALTPGIVAQDGFLTTHLIESLLLPERELIAEFLGKPSDIIDTPTPAQRLIYGEKRRRIPEIWDVDNPMQMGVVQNQDAYMQSVAAQRPYFFAHIKEIANQAMDEFYELTGRRYQRISTYKIEDADYLIVAQGSVISSAEVVADYLREKRNIKVGVVNMTMFRPFPGDLLGDILKWRKGVTVLERTDQPLAEDLPLVREVRAVLAKCVENGTARKGEKPYPKYAQYEKPEDIPPIYSGSFGLGSRDLQPEGIIGVIENMLPKGARKKFFYLSVDFIREKPYTPKQELHQQQLEDIYPAVKDLSIHGSENPNLMPKECITVRFHSVGGWGAMTTGKNLAMTLFDLLEYDIKANPKYGSEKKGQPTTYYLSAAPEPIRINCEYIYVDVVLSPDPNVFGHSNPLNGLKKNGVFVIQSDLETPEKVWDTIPLVHQKFITSNNIRVFYVDGFKIAREEASDAELQFRMQGIAFQGAFFAASPVMKAAKLTEDSLFAAIRGQLQSKFGSKGERVVEDNVRVVRRGFNEIKEITKKRVATSTDKMRTVPAMPILLKRQAESTDSRSNIHRFWEQTGNFYVRGKANDNIADPFIAMSLVPAVTGVYRNMTQVRFDHPVWIPENCTACGDCYTICPDSAIPGLVNSVPEIFDTVIQGVERKGKQVKYLRRAVRTVEKKLRITLNAEGENANVKMLLSQAIDNTLSEVSDEEKPGMEKEFDWFRSSLGDFQFAVTKPYYNVKEKSAKGSGGLFSITINPYTCKGCMECVTICPDDALHIVKQSPKSVEVLEKDWEFWLDLPNISPEYSRIDDLDEKIGALETLMLDKRNYDSMICGDGACLGCGEKTAIHLFTGVVTALQQARVKKQIGRLDDLIIKLDKHIRLKLADSMDINDTDTIEKVVNEHQHKDLTLSRLSAALDDDKASVPVDSEWLNWITELLKKLKHLKWQYTTGTTKKGRSSMGIINATGCTSVWGSTFPYNPYPFPWASHLFQDTPSMAMGVFEGHMSKMADGFKAIRMAELELKGEYNSEKHREFFTYFNWKSFSDEEFRLCPPVVAIGGDGAMYDIGFQNLSRMMMSGMPIKALVLDTQVYSNTGGQACTSGFIGQIADMTPFGPAFKGKEETRKEMSLIGMAHRTTYVLQGAISNITHLLEGYIEGLNSRRPALFNIYAVCQPEHGVADDVSEIQSKLAVESRAYQLLRYDPDAGTTWEECVDLEGNPAMDEDWPTYNLNHKDDEGQEMSMELQMTFADFAFTEARFRKHFRKMSPDVPKEKMVPVVEYIDMDSDDREGLFPYILIADKKNHLTRILVSEEIITSTKERRDLWRLLKSIAGVDKIVDPEQIANQVRSEMAQKISANLIAMAMGNSAAPLISSNPMSSTEATISGELTAIPTSAFEPVWVETPECTTCDECVEINPKIFAYNDKKQAYILDPKAGPFKDIVKAAEKCTANVIHPGTPVNPNEKGLDKLTKRAEKYQ
ncbi:2-oxoacid:acceptor oxidoreductase family protein [Candidatus Parabeggiatoa sp. HSG14]|uniref:2-oxoacid:acceptor oxidoreductase family protein n=1 Tax=Candidatus Parabeggiatoa sp. HSG14 TaxID=3055593 RepID=UPI0025A91C76|nr:2-oxoacid:acceptor oxidoreductase family protein [Thiotrichales bacterium HSG14]